MVLPTPGGGLGGPHWSLLQIPYLIFLIEKEINFGKGEINWGKGKTFVNTIYGNGRGEIYLQIWDNNFLSGAKMIFGGEQT